jgi:ribosome maturation factor RimP
MKYRSADQIGPEHIGRRVTVRRKLAEGGYSDVLGVCEQADATSVTVRNKEGEAIVIERSEIVAARVV